LVPYPL